MKADARDKSLEAGCSVDVGHPMFLEIEKFSLVRALLTFVISAVA